MSIHRFLLIQIDRHVYKYSFRCIQLCSPVAAPSGSDGRAGRARRGRRRHRLHRPGAAAPAVAPSGGRADRGDVVGPDGRVARGACRRWRGSGTARSRRSRPRRSRARPTSCSWRCPMRRRRSSRRRWSTPASASSTCRARSVCATRRLAARWYPETHRLPAGVAYGLTERERGARRARAARRQPGLLSDGDAAGARAARRRRPARRRQPTSSSTPSRACRAPARRRPSGRTSRKSTAAWRPTACSTIATAPKSSRASAATVTFTPHLVPIDRGILATIYVRVAPGTTEEALGDVYEQRLRGRDVRPARRRRRCPRSSTSRTPTSATSAGASTRRAARSWSRSSTTC